MSEYVEYSGNQEEKLETCEMNSFSQVSNTIENNEFKEIEKLEINKSKSSEVKVDVSEMEI